MKETEQPQFVHSPLPIAPGTIASNGPSAPVAINALLDRWLSDESGYDETTWPELKASLERERTTSRRLFDA